jgi:DNA replication licensing factor MCM7
LILSLYLAQVLTCLSGAFEGFLENFKTAPAASITHALGGMNIDEDDLSDEYDFMDEDDEEEQHARRRTRTQARVPKLKYLELLQRVSDRYEEEITIDLDDVEEVCNGKICYLRIILQ